jgi:hypothetical protein
MKKKGDKYKLPIQITFAIKIQPKFGERHEQSLECGGSLAMSPRAAELGVLCSLSNAMCWAPGQ